MWCRIIKHEKQAFFTFREIHKQVSLLKPSRLQIPQTVKGTESSILEK